MTIAFGALRGAQRMAVAAALLACVLPMGACKRNVTTPPVVTTPFVSPALNQGQLLATISVRGIEGSIASLGQMAKDLRLPFSAADLRAMVIARTGVPETLIQHLDLSAPIGFAAVGRQKGTSPFTAAAMSAKSPKAAAAFVDALGTKLREEKGTVVVQTPNGVQMWIYIHGTVLVGSDSIEGLRAAGAHALASRRAKGEDAVVTFYPEAYAQTEGTDVRSALRDLRAQAMANIRSGVGASPLPPEVLATLVGAAIDAFIVPLVDTKAADVALAFDAKLGIRLLGRLMPNPQTALARSFANVRPYAVDRALLSAPLPPGLFAVNYSTDTIKRYQQALQAVAGIELAGVKSMAAGLQALAGNLTGAQSGRFSFERGFEHTLLVPLHATASAEATMSAVENILGPTGLGTLVRETHKLTTQSTPAGSPTPLTPKVAWQRQGLKGRLDIAASATNKGRADAAVLGLLGADHLSYSVMIAGNRLLTTSSPKGEAHLAQFTGVVGSNPAAADPEMQQVLKETMGREGFVYADLFRLLRPALAVAAKTEPSLAQANAVLAFIPQVDRLRVPVIASYVGGANLTIEVSVPYRTLQNVSALLAPLLGLGLGGSLMGPQ